MDIERRWFSRWMPLPLPSLPDYGFTSQAGLVVVSPHSLYLIFRKSKIDPRIPSIPTVHGQIGAVRFCKAQENPLTTLSG